MIKIQNKPHQQYILTQHKSAPKQLQMNDLYEGKRHCLAIGKHVFQIKQNQMQSYTKQMQDSQTETNSPKRHTPFNLNKHNNPHQHIQPTQISTHHRSLTQQQIYSRDLVREIIQKDKNNTIRHQIGKVDINTSLYARPRIYDPQQFRFDSIPPQNPNYSSLGSAKIREINKGMRSRATTVSFSHTSLTSSKRYNSKSESSKKIDNSEQTQVKFSRVSVSGLATYKFASVKAERSLALNRTNYEQKLTKQLQQISKRRDCARNRFNKVLLKQSSNRYNEKIRRQNKTMADDQTNTDQYLQDIREENERERLLYGDKAKKLQFIKDYMNLEQTSYDVASHIVNQIQLCRQGKTEKGQPKRVVKTQMNEELQFAGRRIPVMKSRLKVKYITFVE